jgi:hypothetical protein
MGHSEGDFKHLLDTNAEQNIGNGKIVLPQAGAATVIPQTNPERFLMLSGPRRTESVGLSMPTEPVAATGSELARELRSALDELGELVENGDEHVCMVEDAFGVEYSAVDRGPTEVDQAKTKAELPEALKALAQAENRLRRELWLMARARRSLARLLREEHGNSV